MEYLDLSALTTAQLQTMLSNLTAAHARALSAKSYQVGARSLTRESADSILAQIAQISAELAARNDDTGGVGVIGFGEPQ